MILSALILLLAFATQPGSCKSVTAAADTIPAFSFDILPDIERDLALCDLIKEKNSLLTAQVAIKTVEVDQERRGRLAAESQVKKEKRKRIFSHVVRTVAEVAAILILLKTL